MAVLAAAALAGPTSTDAGVLGGWLAVEDPPEPCPVIVVLNGDQPVRADEAARLHRADTGTEVWLTRDPRSGSGAGDDAGAVSNAARLVSHGVPRDAIRVLPGAAAGTQAEVRIIGAELRRRALHCAVLVTSPIHGRRVKVSWRRVVGDTPRAIVRHARDAGYTGWRAELRELGLTLLALIGLPR